MIVVIDNREQRPLLFDKEGSDSFPGLKIEWGTLTTGDYSIKGYSSPVSNGNLSLIFLAALAGAGNDFNGSMKEWLNSILQNWWWRLI